MGNKQEQKQNRTKLKKKEIMFSLPFNFNSVRIFISFSFFVMLTVCFFLCVLFHHSYSLALDCYCVVVAAVTVFQVLRSADFPILFISLFCPDIFEPILDAIICARLPVLFVVLHIYLSRFPFTVGWISRYLYYDDCLKDQTVYNDDENGICWNGSSSSHQKC